MPQPTMVGSDRAMAPQKLAAAVPSETLAIHASQVPLM